MKHLDLKCVEQVARCAGVPYVDLAAYRISPGILRKLPLDAAKELRCVPMVFNHRRLVLVHDDLARALVLVSDPSALFGSAAIPGYRSSELADPRPEVEIALTSRLALDATLERMERIPT